MINRFDEQHKAQFQKMRGFLVVWGVILFILGIFAIAASVFTTFLTIVLIGALLLVSGIVIGIDALIYQRPWGNFFIHFLVAVLYILIGLIFFFKPIIVSMSLTLMLGIFFIIVGFFRIFYSSLTKLPNWGWQLLNGVLTLILGLLILSNWPASSLFIIGLFVGIDLLFCGIAYLMIGAANPANPGNA